MKNLIFLLLLAPAFCLAQNPIFFQTSFNTATAATPTFSPAAGSITPQTVTISSATSGASITYCTISSGTCTPSTSGSTVSVTPPLNVCAFATKAAFNQSATACANYTAAHLMGVIQQVQCTAGSSPATCTLSPTAAGNSVLVSCLSFVTDASIAFSPSATAIYTSTGNGSYQSSGLWIISNITTGTTSVSITNDQNQRVICEAAEVSGLVTSLPVDIPATLPGTLATGTAGTGSASAYTGSITTTNANDVIVGLANFLANSGSTTATAGTGYASIGQSTVSTYSTWMEFKNVSSIGSYNPGATFSGSGNLSVLVGTAALKLQ